MSDLPIAAEQAAIKACEYARQYILKGGTQLENNALVFSRIMALNKAVNDLRRACHASTRASEFITNEINRFYSSVELSKKYSLGNCFEYAKLALEYMINSDSNLNAEVFKIKGGDHTFMVIGRKSGSNPRDPSEWGDSAYICDPWANQVYPAVEYLSKLKNFYRTYTAQGYVNNVEDFDPARHQLKAVYNGQNIKKFQISIYCQYGQNLLRSINDLEKRLVTIAERLADKYGKDDEKYSIIIEQIKQLRATSESLKYSVKNDISQLKKQSKRNLDGNLKTHIKAYYQAISSLEKNSPTLKHYRNPDSWRTKALQFFNILPSSAKNTESALEDAKKDIKEIINKL